MRYFTSETFQHTPPTQPRAAHRLEAIESTPEKEKPAEEQAKTSSTSDAISDAEYEEMDEMDEMDDLMFEQEYEANKKHNKEIYGPKEAYGPPYVPAENVESKTDNVNSNPPVLSKEQEDFAKLQLHHALNKIEKEAQVAPDKAVSGNKAPAALKTAAQKIIVAKDTYDEFAAEYPTLARYGLGALNILFQTSISGLIGFVNSVRGEAMGEAIGALAGEQIAGGIHATMELGADKLQAQYKDLTRDEAMALIGASMIASAAVVDGSGGVKQVLNKMSAKNAANVKPRVDVPDHEIKTPQHAEVLKEDLHTRANHVPQHILQETGLSKADVEKFGGEKIHRLAENSEFAELTQKWGIGKDGTNQLLEHTLGKAHQPDRLASIERHAGLAPGSLTDVYSDNPKLATQALRNFDDLVPKIKESTVIIDNGAKRAYWLESKIEPGKGIAYVEYAGKPQTIMNINQKQFLKTFALNNNQVLP